MIVVYESIPNDESSYSIMMHQYWYLKKRVFISNLMDQILTIVPPPVSLSWAERHKCSVIMVREKHFRVIVMGGILGNHQP